MLPEPFGKKTCSLNCEDSHVGDFTGQSLHSLTEIGSISNQIEMVPEPSSTKTCSTKTGQSLDYSTELVSYSKQKETLPEPFPLYQSFSRHFSGKNTADHTERAHCFSPAKTSPSSHVKNEESEKAPQKESSPLCDNVDHRKESFSTTFQPSIIDTPVHMINPPHSLTCNNSETPDTKNISCTADSFMTETPVQSAPARLLPVSDVKPQHTPTQVSTSCHKPAKRVLNFSLMEDNDDLGIGVHKLESSRALDEIDSFPESSRGCSEHCCNSVSSASVPQKVCPLHLF